MLNLEYLTNTEGNTIAVVIPLEIWRQLLPTQDASLDELAEAVEDYCMNKAMNESMNTPLLNRSKALAYLEEE
ncbi:hypothetical protein [Dolichospermum flos-aquae]|uniref:Uncharacterized protein n=1 Tax=Dolichospermum flos-aquae CCAP 1403/13F TaxID=315271 RepID=A0A6H2C593_DOLFA|nr:hypothetical protein [Dolichospermum flos-aquae]QJB46491.1 hypothetical protein HGD76_22215 [Dolichospermum flos-aquae CCAP 1403/13F]